ncbi:antifreeze protein [Frigidibacter sp. ROC022]|uniref:antifreeze protein n=1 Tax=Frigidibacter sp. ROC022 TaxID=2971796 RepID=UPI00215A6E8F|nr:antifreeze protein [Frigidibacter sp. ROC022]MCR8723968.1 antifreeze protein [Frigidibacter sp. ROC022]
MPRASSPDELLTTGLQAWDLWAEASQVIGLRLMGMLGLTDPHPQETLRMVTEKQAAFAQSALAGTRAALQGARPDQIANAAMAPLKRKTAANARRLTRAQKP